MRTASKYFITAALAVLTLTGCNSESNEPEVIGRKDYPDFTAVISGIESRAFNQSWEQGDEIGISGAGRTNVCYLTNGLNGTFDVKTPGEQIYFQDENEVTFTAYYPYTDLEANAMTISADTKVQPDQKKFDFLWTQANGSKNSPNVNLNFAHRMAKVSFTVRPGDGMSFDEVKAARLSLSGFSHTGSFDVNNGKAVADNTVVSDWSFTDEANKAPVEINDTEKLMTFSLIFFPQMFDNPLAFSAELDLTGDRSYNLAANIDFTAANREKDGADAKNEWVAGRQYNLSLTLHKTEITVDKCVIDPWSVVDGGEIDVD